MMRKQSCIANYSGGGRGTDVQRSTENVALVTFHGTKAREFDAVEKALEETGRLDNGDLRLKMVNLVYFARAVDKLDDLSTSKIIPYECRTVRQWHGDFVRCVAKHMGLMDD